MTTASTTSRTSTGADMPPTVAPLTTVGKEPETEGFPGWTVRAAKRLGYTPSTLYGRCFDKDRSWFHAVAVVVEEMLRDDKDQLADRRLLELDLARAGIDPSTTEHEIALLDDAGTDAADEVPRLRLVQDPGPASWATFERISWDVIRKRYRLIKSGRTIYREAHA